MKDEVGTLDVYIPISIQGLRSSHGTERRGGSQSEVTTSAERLRTTPVSGEARETPYLSRVKCTKGVLPSSHQSKKRKPEVEGRAGKGRHRAGSRFAQKLSC